MSTDAQGVVGWLGMVEGCTSSVGLGVVGWACAYPSSIKASTGKYTFQSHGARVGLGNKRPSNCKMGHQAFLSNDSQKLYFVGFENIALFGFPLRMSVWPVANHTCDPSRTFALFFQTPAEPMRPRLYRPHRCCPRSQHAEGFSAIMISGLTQGLSTYCLRFTSSVAHRPCKARVRLAGWAFTSYLHLLLLSRTYPDASWAHARRKLFELADIATKARNQKSTTISPIAFEAVRKIDAIFMLERSIDGLSPEQRVAARRRDVAPLVNDLTEWMKRERAKLSRHNEVAKAMDYMAQAHRGLHALPRRRPHQPE
jgi:transposase IS66 family protein